MGEVIIEKLDIGYWFYDMIRNIYIVLVNNFLYWEDIYFKFIGLEMIISIGYI